MSTNNFIPPENPTWVPNKGTDLKIRNLLILNLIDRFNLVPEKGKYLPDCYCSADKEAT